MSYSIMRVEKVKGSFITGIQIHNQREKELSNKDIDNEKSDLNYDLHNGGPVNYNDKFNEIISNNGIERYRKDAVKAVDILTTSDSDFFKSLSSDQTKKYFNESYKFICDKFGKDNVIASVVHMDEKTPHMHTTIVPITEDKKLSAKDMFNPRTLRELQTDYHRRLNNCGFKMERGVTSDRKHIKLEEYKHQTRIKEYSIKENELISKVNDIEKSLDKRLQNIDKLVEKRIEQEKNNVLKKNYKPKNINELAKELGIKNTILSKDKITMSKESFKNLYKEITKGTEEIATAKAHISKIQSDLQKKAQEFDTNEKAYKQTIAEQNDKIKKISSSRWEQMALNIQNRAMAKSFAKDHKLEKEYADYPKIFESKKLAEKISNELEKASKLRQNCDELLKAKKWDEYGTALEKRDEQSKQLSLMLKSEPLQKIIKNNINLSQKIEKHQLIEKTLEIGVSKKRSLSI